MMMEKILGNFLSQANKNFPLDCETLDYFQRLTSITEVIGNIAGDRAVLYGCAQNTDGTMREPGYVFVRTEGHPEGEILPWEGGAIESGMYIKQEDINVSANNQDYPKAYTRRSLSPGIGSENFDWEDFTDIKNLRALMQENETLRGEIKQMAPPPLGIVQMWAGMTVPTGYLLCDGRVLSKEDYPELFAVLGTSFNSGISAAGSAYTTDSGFFRLPDLRGRFIVGQHDSDVEYQQKGSAGGHKSVALNGDNLPEHNHKTRDYMMIPFGAGECRSGEWTIGGKSMTVGYETISGNPKRHATSDKDREHIQWIEHDTENSGDGNSFDIRPPYYALAYIIRAK